MTNCAETLKQDFDITESLLDLKFTEFTKNPYQKETKEAVFGEKLCILYSVGFTTYNIGYSLKILAFAYEKIHEILKLDITLHDEKLQQEFKTCRNFLQRHRSLNATFRTLIQFSKFIEARRLINTIVLSKQDKISLTHNEDGSLQIEYFSNLSGILIRVSWKVEWSIKDCEFMDVIEVYYNNFELPTTDTIKEKLTALTHHSLDFHSKLRLWTNLMSDLNTSEEHVKKRKMDETDVVISEVDTILVISDGEEDMQHAGNRKKRRVTPQSCDMPVIFVPD